MIRLTKSPEPNILRDNAVKWSLELLAAIAGGKKRDYLENRYNQPEIKNAIKSETHEKCAYCESKPLATDYGDIEHIAPKKWHPELAFKWENLTLACGVCNTNKGDTEGVLDPYTDDPEDFFIFAGALIFGKPGSPVGEVTERVLKLNRLKLVERRKEAIENLMDHVRRIQETRDPALRATLCKALLTDFVMETQEYAAFKRAYVEFLRTKGLVPATC